MLFIKEETVENPNEDVNKLLDDFADYLEDEENIYVTDVDYSTKVVYVDTIEDLKKSRCILRNEYPELKQLGAHVLSTIGADGLNKDYIRDTKTQTESLLREGNKLTKDNLNDYGWCVYSSFPYPNDSADCDQEIENLGYLRVLVNGRWNNRAQYYIAKNPTEVQEIKNVIKKHHGICGSFKSTWDKYKTVEVLTFNKKKYGDNYMVIDNTKKTESLLIEDEDRYIYIKSKEVYDDGWRTEYTMYQDSLDPERYVFVFGDSDLYDPNDGYEEFDWECEGRDEAEDWFYNYEGYDSEED